MSLFTDPGVISLDDLLLFESSLVDVCSTHGIDARTKIKIATDGIGDKLLLWLLSANQSTSTWNTSAAFDLNNIVVTPPVYRWLCFDSLARVFAEAYNTQLNTRFQGKWTEYQKEAQEAARLVYASGLRLVNAPLAKPDPPIIQVGPGALSLSALFVQMTWVNRRGQEGAPSPVNATVLSGFSSITIAPSGGGVVPTEAVGWSVYAGETQQVITRQNAAPLGMSDSWQIPSSGLVRGSLAGQGQTPDLVVTLGGKLQRG